MTMARSTIASAFVLTLGVLAGPLSGAAINQDAKAPPTDRHGDALPAGARLRLGTVRFRHAATAIAYSPDGKLLACGGRDNTIRLFDAASGKEVRRLPGHLPRSYNPPADGRNILGTLVGATGEGGVNSVAFAPDGKTLASGGWDDTVRLWDVATGRELRKIDAHKAMVGRVVFSPDGRVLASRGGLDGTARLWDPVTGTQLQKFVGLSNINPWRFNHDLALAFAPDGKTLAATARSALVFFDVASGAERLRVPAHVYGIALAYSPDGKRLASGGVDAGKDVYSLRIWDPATGKELRRCRLPKNEPPTYLAWDPGNTGRLAAVVAEDDIHIFDTNTGQEVVRIKHYWPSRLAYAPDGRTLASAGSGPTVRLWDAATGKELHRNDAGHRAAVAAVAVSPDGKLVASGAEDVRLWERATGKPVRTIEVPGGVTCLAFAPDGKTLAAGGGRVARLYDLQTGQAAAELKPHANRVLGLAFSPDGRLLATGDAQATIRLWDVRQRRVVREIDNRSATEALALAFAPDGKTLFGAGAWNDSSFLPKKGQTITINGKKVEIKDDFVLKIQGVTMTRKEGYYVLQWDPATGKEVRRFGGLKDAVRALALSPDGKRLAAASRDGKICLWDPATGKDLLHVVAHPMPAGPGNRAAPALAFAPDGRTLASAGADRAIRLWDATTAREVGQFRAPDGAVTGLAFTPDGKTLVSGGNDTAVLLWDVAAAGTMPRPKAKVITIR